MDDGGEDCYLFPTFSLHCKSSLRLPYRILNAKLVKPKRELQWRLYWHPYIKFPETLLDPIKGPFSNYARPLFKSISPFQAASAQSRKAGRSQMWACGRGNFLKIDPETQNSYKPYERPVSAFRTCINDTHSRNPKACPARMSGTDVPMLPLLVVLDS